MPNITVNQLDINKRLDVFLAEYFTELSRSQWQKKIKAGKVLVNGRTVSASRRIKEKDKVEITNYSDKVASPQQGGDKLSIINRFINKFESKDKKINKKFNLKNIKVVFEGDNYIVVNKPAGIVVHPDSKYKQDTLVDWLLKRYPELKEVGEQRERPGIVHRLDKEVSGLMVVARSQQMFEHLKDEFQARRVNKEYLALVHGVMRADEGRIKVPIKRSKAKGVFVADSTFGADSKPALTHYEVIKRYKNFTLLKVRIVTGRTHQIRVHLSSIGHSVAGDKLYATHDVRVKKKGVELGRLWLHAAELIFNDLNYQRQRFTAGLPIELEKFLAGLK